jgi:hypothetical protein
LQKFVTRTRKTFKRYFTNIFFVYLTDTLIDISNGKVHVTTKNVYYWITHYVFNDADGITESTVKKHVKKIAKELGMDLANKTEKKEEEGSSDSSLEEEENENSEDETETKLEHPEKESEEVLLKQRKRIIRLNYQ